MLKFSFLLLLALPTILLAEPLSMNLDRADYDGFKVFTVTLRKHQLTLLDDLKSRVAVDTWMEPKALNKKMTKMMPIYKTDFMVAPEDVTTVLSFLESHQLQHEVKVEDVGAVVREQKEESIRYQQSRTDVAGVKAIDWKSYYTYEEINGWLDDIVAENSDYATVDIIGKTTLGKDIKRVKISLPGSPANKPAVFIDGGFHAREWISPAITTWMINNLLTNRNDPTNQAALADLDFHIVVLVNADGYVHSHTNSRMWRKTRSNHNSALGCLGVDPNRNSDFHFGGGGTSNDKCSDIYRGPSAFSEPEVKAVADAVNGNLGNWIAYFTIHSYGQMWLNPWSWTYDVPSDYNNHMAFAKAGTDAIKASRGKVYDYGESSDVYGITAGSSDDWAYGVAGVPYSQTIEVGTGTFETPTSEIIPIATEAWAGIVASSLSATKK